MVNITKLFGLELETYKEVKHGNIYTPKGTPVGNKSVAIIFFLAGLSWGYSLTMIWVKRKERTQKEMTQLMMNTNMPYNEKLDHE